MKQPGKGRGKTLAMGLTLGILCSSSVFAAEDTQKDVTTEENATPIGFEIALGTEMMSGNTTYSIGYPITEVGGGTDEGYFPFSELEWPLDIWLARIDASVNIGPSWRVNGTLKKNISDPGDPMIYKDWNTDSNPGQLDIYSTSNISDFDALIFDFDVEWVFLQRQSFNLYAGLGYQYQKFEYDGQLIHQYSPSGLSGWEYYGDGSVSITYEMTYKMPYMLIGGDYQITPNFTVAGSFGFSPLVDAQDEDHHLLRDKVSKGDMDGNAYMFDVSGTYDFLSSWFVEAGFHYTKIDVDGDQNLSFSGIPTYVVYEESESTQTSGYLTIGYKF
jgi:outer membrane protease